MNSFSRPLIVAHRGDVAHVPENTLEAFASAIQAGADAIELDVQESIDGEVCVFHDLYLGRTVAGQAPFGSLTAAQIRELDAGIMFDPCYTGLRVPTLAEVLEQWRGQIRFEIELKTPSRSLAEKALAAIEMFGVEDAVEITSGHLPLLCWLHERHAMVEIGTWFSLPPAWMRAAEYLAQMLSYADLMGLRVIHLHESMVTDHFVEGVRQSGRIVQAANLNSESAILQAVALGVDRFTTNRIRDAVRILSNL